MGRAAELYEKKKREYEQQKTASGGVSPAGGGRVERLLAEKGIKWTPSTTPLNPSEVTIDRNTWAQQSSKPAVQNNQYSSMASEVTRLESRKKDLENERILAQAEIAEGRGTDTSRYDSANNELKVVNARLKELNAVRPDFDRNTAQGLQDAFTAAEETLSAKYGSTDEVLSRLEQSGASISTMEEALRDLLTRYNAAPTQELYDEYSAAYGEYQKAINDHNALYNEYKPVYDSYNEYSDYMAAARSDASFGDIVWKAMKSGVGQINDAFTGALAKPEKLISKVLPGVSTPFTDIHEYYSGIRDRYESDRADSVYNRGEFAEKGSELLAATVAAAPQAIIASATGGTSVAAQSAANLAAVNAGNAGMAAVISNSLTTMAKNPSYWLSMMQTIDSDYDAAKAKGADDLTALATAIITSALNAGVEIGGGIEKLPQSVREGGEDAIALWVKSSLEEGREEMIQSIISGITAKATYDPGREWYSTTNEEAIVNPGRLAEEFAMGTGVGGILGGFQTAAAKVQNAVDNAKVRRTLEAAAAEMLDKRIEQMYESNHTTQAENAAEVHQNAIAEGSVESAVTTRAAEDVNEPIMGNSTAFGAEGQRVYNTAVTNAREHGVSEVKARGEITRAYISGLVGSKKPKAKVLSKDTLDMMYRAGQNDAKASLAAEKANAQFATVYGEEGGLIYSPDDAYVNSLDKELVNQLNIVGKVLGVKIQFADQVNGGKSNGQIQNGVVTIAKDAVNPVRVVLGHEITHRMQELAPAEYRAFRDAALALYKSDAYRDLTVAKYMQDYSEGVEGAMDEIASDVAGKMMADGKMLDDFISRNSSNRTLLEWLRDFFRDLGAKLTGAFQSDAKRAEQKLTKALNASAKQVAKIGEQKNTTQKSGVRSSVKLGGFADITVDVQAEIGFFGINGLNDYVGVQKTVYNKLLQAGFFDEATKRRTIENADTGIVVEIGRDGIYETFGPDMRYARLPSELKRLKIATVRHLPDIIRYGEVVEGDAANIHNANSGVTYTYLEHPVAVGNKTLYVVVDIRQSPQKNKFWMHSVRVNTKRSQSLTANSDMSASAQTRDVASDKKVSHPEEIVKTGVALDEKTESVSPARQSLKTWNASEYVQARKDAAKEMAKALDISEKKALAYIDSVNSIAKMIADDRVRLDYEASPDRSSFISNVEYGGSIDFSTICKKRRLYTGTFEAIQNALPNTALTAEEILEIRSMMDKKGYEVSCGLCYVEGSRANMGQYAKQFLEEYKQTNPSYMPNMAEINTPNGLEKIRIQHPEVYEAYESFMNKLAQRKPKLYQLQTEYQGEILNKFRKKDVSKKNENGGLRMQSFSDFEIIHLIDCMQVIMDMSRVGLAGQAYTKVPDFAWALGDTGLKINLSLIAKGVDNKGRLILDEKEGMSEKDAMALRDRYSENVGTIVVVFTDRQLKAAMADERIDYIIPFHRSQWNKEQYELMGLPANAKDFTSWQNESYIEPVYSKSGKKQRPANYMPNAYWDFNKSGRENAEAYLQMCAANNRRPKFHYLLVNNKDGSYSLQPDGTTDGYWKTLIDFKMYDNDGKGVPQRPVRPDFNMEQAQRMLSEYTGGHAAFPAANDVVDEFVSKYKAEHKGAKFSLKGSDRLAEEVDRIMAEAKASGTSKEDVQARIDEAVNLVWDELATEYGTMKPGEKPVREVQVPKRTSDDKKVSQTVRTILEAKATPDEALPSIKQMVAASDFSYDVYTDEAAIADAENSISKVGWAQALADWTSSMKKGEVSKKNTALGWALYNNAANSGDMDTALTILNYMVKHQRNAAQAVQATRILKKLSPETQLYQAQRSVDSLQEELNERYGKKAPDLKIDQTLAEQYMKAKDQAERDEVLKNIYRDIGRQMPSTFVDKWNAWRYLAMLGNLRTHGRNLVGNAGFAPVVVAKNLTATAIEEAVSRLSGGKIERSKAFVGASKNDRALLKAAWDYFPKVVEEAMAGGKYDDFANANKYIEEGRQIFKFKPLEAARKGNSKALDKEDMWFSQPHFAAAMASYCKAHGITAEQIARGKAIKPAVAYAVKEAQKATYRDTNALSQAIAEMGRYSGKNPVKKGLSTMMEGVLPFRKTPANILARGLEYSPAGLLKGLTVDLAQVAKGDKTAAEAIDNISAGLTGTGLLALGLWAAAEGLIRGHGDDEEEENDFKEMMGHQAYALELPNGKSVTLDWLAPEALPLFVGVNLWEQTSGEGEELTLAAMLNAAKTVTEPMLEMSCLQSLNDVFESVGYVTSEGLDGLPAALASVATSYLTQAIPTLLGQAERTGEDVRMTTYTEKNAFLTSDMQYTLGKISAKLPGIDYQQVPYIDAWGRTESSGGVGERAFNNFLNPAYTSQIETSAMEEELLRLFEETGEGSVLPSRAAKYFTVNGERKDLTAEEYVKYAQNKGQTSYSLMTKLTGNKQYGSMNTEQKVKAVEDIYDYANQTAKASISDYEVESWVAKAQEAEKKYGISPDVYTCLKTQASGIESLKDKNGESIDNSKGLLVMQMVYNTPGLTESQRQAMFEYLGVGKTIQKYNKALVNQKLEKMKRQAK